MVKPFYKFGDNIFRDELWKEYIVPVAQWFMHDKKPEGYLLPQFSGSVWECSLAIDFLLKLYAHSNVENELKELIKIKVVNTARWLNSTLMQEESVGGMSWDSAPWDTAVALRTLLSCFEQFDTSFTDKEQIVFKEHTISVCQWLLLQSKNWKAPDGYLTADATDLAVTLSVLIAVQKKYPSEFSVLECNYNCEGSINATAKMLLQCVYEGSAYPVEQYKLCNWGSCFNIGEVICGLCSYISWPKCDETNKKETQDVILAGLKYIEHNQNNGGITDNSVADSCGITWCYLLASQSVKEYGHDDTMVFRSLCWMCDSNKVLDDGSFLHSSYVTVFYALTLMEVYETWELGKKSTNEVYHFVVWLNPNIETFERAKRLDLELKAKNYETQIDKMKKNEAIAKINRSTFIVVFSLVVLTLIVLQLSGAITLITINFQFLDASMFFSIIGVALVIIPGAWKISYEFAKQKIYHKTSARFSIGENKK